MKKLLIISHNYHSFLLNEINFAAHNFDEVHVIALYNQEIEAKFQFHKNIYLHFFDKKKLRACGLKRIYTIFKLENIREIINTINTNGLSIKYIKELLMYFSIDSICSEVVKNIGISKENSINWRALSCWYSSDAYALYKLKKVYPNIKIYSLAHSYEVDKIKNKYILNLFRSSYHSSFEKVSFISKNVKMLFLEDVAKELGLETANVDVKYLGTVRQSEVKCLYNKMEPYHVVTCSYVTPVKRVELLYKILSDNVDIPLKWTHIGKGENYNEFSKLIRNSVGNKYLEIELLGAITNEQIHQYYSENPIDLFINFSLSEGIPVSIMEAIAYGIPVIATDVGGNSEIVDDTFGYVVKTNIDGITLWENIKKMLLASDNEKQNIKHYAVDCFENKFNANKIREDFYKEM